MGKKVVLTQDKLNKLIREAVDELTAYHGTGANFDRFDLAKAFTGAGSAAFGFGVYVTSDPTTAKDYAKIAQARVLLHNGRKVYSSKSDDNENMWNPYRLIFDLFSYDRTITKARKHAETLYDMCEDDNTEMKKLWGEVVNILTSSRSTDWKFSTERIMVEVDIPDDEYDWIDWNEDAHINDLLYISQRLPSEMQRRMFVREFALDDKDNDFPLKWHAVYEFLCDTLNGAKNASMFLSRIGFVGIRFNGGSIYKNNRSYINYVVFNEDDVKIVDKEYLN